MLELFLCIFKIGLFTFGGGAAMLSILEAELVAKKKWVKKKELIDYYAIGQTTPGIIAINTATLVGYKKFGVKGAILASVAMVLPSFIIITAIAFFSKSFLELPEVKSAFAGIRVVVSAMILQVLIKMWRTSISRKSQLSIFAVCFLILIIFDTPPAIIAITSGLFGFLYYRKRPI
ncbi:MAG: chromate transporter [Alphaproteobacteria bacterium]